MTFPTDWNVDKYKVDYESDEHWELRRRFLVAHKSKYPEDRLVCLAQVFYNVEFMGCRYPEKTMKLVAKLSSGVADEHREKMKTKLQRTFVQASDAASTKVKGHKVNKVAAPIIKFDKSSNLEIANFSSPSVPTEENTIPEGAGRYVLASQNLFQAENEKRKLEHDSASNKRVKVREKVNTGDEQQGSHSKVDSKFKQIFSQFVILHNTTNPIAILAHSADAAKMTHKFSTNKLPSGLREVSFCINDTVLSKTTNSSESEAKIFCAQEALKILKECCYTLILKDRFATSISIVEKDAGETSQSVLSKEICSLEGTVDIKAQRMMKLMGWGGKGLGRNEQGREEPVQAVRNISRAGLGASSGKSSAFEKNMRALLEKFKWTNDGNDLVFAADFSNPERATIHKISRGLGLKSRSFGVEPNRQLIVSKKQTPWEIVQEVLKAGGCTDKYEVIPPTSF